MNSFSIPSRPPLASPSLPDNFPKLTLVIPPPRNIRFAPSITMDRIFAKIGCFIIYLPKTSQAKNIRLISSSDEILDKSVSKISSLGLSIGISCLVLVAAVYISRLTVQKFKQIQNHEKVSSPFGMLEEGIKAVKSIEVIGIERNVRSVENTATKSTFLSYRCLINGSGQPERLSEELFFKIKDAMNDNDEEKIEGYYFPKGTVRILSSENVWSKEHAGDAVFEIKEDPKKSKEISAGSAPKIKKEIKRFNMALVKRANSAPAERAYMPRRVLSDDEIAAIKSIAVLGIEGNVEKGGNVGGIETKSIFLNYRCKITREKGCQFLLITEELFFKIKKAMNNNGEENIEGYYFPAGTVRELSSENVWWKVHSGDSVSRIEEEIKGLNMALVNSADLTFKIKVDVKGPSMTPVKGSFMRARIMTPIKRCKK